MSFLKRFVFQPLLVLFLIAVLAISIRSLSTKPSNDRAWSLDQKVLSYTETQGNLITIRNIRNFAYASTTSYTPNYYDKTFDLNKIKRVWYIVEPFSGLPGSAHTFLSFEFEGNQFVSVSVEIRKEVGENFHPITGLFRKYELMYIFADEKDVIKLRTNYRKDLVYVYPIKADAEKVRGLFLDMANRANTLKDRPEFYNTLTNNCTTNIVKHVNTITPNRAPLWNPKVLMPAYSDRLAYDLGLIDTDLSFEEARKKYFINDRAMKYADAPDFSMKIRE